MRLKDGYELIKIIEEWVVVPVGDKMLAVNGILTLSESGAFLWDKLKNDLNISELVSLLLAEYGVDENTAEIDVNEFVADLKKLGLLEE